jgi:hypothetical protein
MDERAQENPVYKKVMHNFEPEEALAACSS